MSSSTCIKFSLTLENDFHSAYQSTAKLFWSLRMSDFFKHSSLILLDGWYILSCLAAQPTKLYVLLLKREFSVLLFLFLYQMSMKNKAIKMPPISVYIWIQHPPGRTGILFSIVVQVALVIFLVQYLPWVGFSWLLDREQCKSHFWWVYSWKAPGCKQSVDAVLSP